MDRDGLADFLRRRREALRPEDVGLSAGRRRRTAGLRREEVAALASMSTDFYTRLEQRRGSRPSEPMVASIARALRLTQDERDHLFQLAGHVAPPRGHRSSHVSPALMRVLDRLDTPAQVTDDLGAVLRQNALAEALLGDPHRAQRHRRRGSPTRRPASATRRPITPPTRAATSPTCARSTAAATTPRRARWSTNCARNAEFAALWERHEVAAARRHPQAHPAPARRA